MHENVSMRTRIKPIRRRPGPQDIRSLLRTKGTRTCISRNMYERIRMRVAVTTASHAGDESDPSHRNSSLMSVDPTQSDNDSCISISSSQVAELESALLNDQFEFGVDGPEPPEDVLCDMFDDPEFFDSYIDGLPAPSASWFEQSTTPSARIPPDGDPAGFLQRSASLVAHRGTPHSSCPSVHGEFGQSSRDGSHAMSG